MKKLKTLGIITLCICLVASAFAGCTKKVSLEGTWRTTIDLTEFVKELDMSDDEDGEFFGEFNEQLSIDLLYIFDEDNNFTVTIDEEKFKTDFDAINEKYYEYVLEGTYKMAENEGITREELDEFYKEDYGKTLKESLVEELAMDESYDEFINSIQQTEPQPTLIDGDRAYSTDDQGNYLSYETFVLDGDTLTITGNFDMEDKPIKDNENYTYPMVFTKQAATAEA